MKHQFTDPQLQKIFDAICVQKAETADAIVWLQGDRLDRGAKVVSLFRDGFASRVIVTGNNILVGPAERPDENDLPLSSLVEYLVHNAVPPEAVLVEDASFNTAQQAKHVIALAHKFDWKRLLIVSSPYHQLRAFLTFLHAAEIQHYTVTIINQPALELPWNASPSGRAHSAAELLKIEAKKIVDYTSDVATVDRASDYVTNKSV